MKIVFTGGGTGGHFYPLIAVAEELNTLVDRQNIAEAHFYYFGDSEYDKQALFEQGIEFRQINAGKLRLGGSSKNISDIFRTLGGVVQALVALFSVFPDVVFAKGGYSSFPTLCAARILGIPVMIHESDSVPGRVNIWAGKFAKRIAVSYPDAVKFFKKKDRIAHTGQPIRHAVSHVTKHGSQEYLKLQEDLPTLFILGGSQGAQRINDAIAKIIPQLLTQYQVIHQVGEQNLEEYNIRLDAILEGNQYRNRYKVFGFLNQLAMSMSAGVASLVISRAGSTIFEIALWEVPSIIIPIPEDLSRDQRSNAFSYARTGAAEVIEEKNLGSHVLLAEIERILGDEKIYREMSASARDFAQKDAAKKIAEEIIEIGLSHEK